jgi:uncharacterized protein
MRVDTVRLATPFRAPIFSAMTKPATPRVRKCPICGKPAQQGARPFCSDRCKQFDLNRWLSGSYAIVSASDEDGKPSG